MEVVGSIASIAQLATIVFSISKTLYEVGDALSNASSDIKDLARDLETFSEELNLLSSLLDNKTSRYSEQVYRLTAKIIGDCATICVKIDKILRKLRSGSVMARIKWLYKEKEIVKLLTRLRDLKLSLMGMLGMLSALKADHMMDAMGVQAPSLIEGGKNGVVSKEIIEDIKATRKKLESISVGQDSEVSNLALATQSSWASEDSSTTTLMDESGRTSSSSSRLSSRGSISEKKSILDGSFNPFISTFALPGAGPIMQNRQAIESVQSFHSALSFQIPEGSPTAQSNSDAAQSSQNIEALTQSSTTFSIPAKQPPKPDHDGWKAEMVLLTMKRLHMPKADAERMVSSITEQGTWEQQSNQAHMPSAAPPAPAQHSNPTLRAPPVPLEQSYQDYQPASNLPIYDSTMYRPSPMPQRGPGIPVQPVAFSRGRTSKWTHAKPVSYAGDDWGDGDDDDYMYEEPPAWKDEFISSAEAKPREGEDSRYAGSKSKGWAAAAAAGGSTETSRSSESQESEKAFKYRGVVLELEDSSLRQPYTQTFHMPGGSDEDLNFIAHVAAGLQDSGFDPDVVINDPSFRRRNSLPGFNAPGTYRAPFAETITDLGTYPPGRTGDQSFVIGEVEKIPQEGGRSISPEGDDAIPRLSKKEQKKRNKAAKRKEELAEDITPITAAPIAPQSAEDPESYFETPKKSKKKSKRGQSGFDNALEESSSRNVAVPVDAFDDLKAANGEGEWAEPKKSKQSKRDSERYASPSRSVPSSKADADSSKKSKDKSRRKSEGYELNPSEVPLPSSPLSEPSEYLDASSLRKSNRDSGISNAADRDDYQSVVSSSRRYEDEARRKKKSRSSTREDFDDTRSVASTPAGDEEGRKKKEGKRGGFFGLFGSKSEVGVQTNTSKDDFEDVRKSKREKVPDSSSLHEALLPPLPSVPITPSSEALDEFPESPDTPTPPRRRFSDQPIKSPSQSAVSLMLMIQSRSTRIPLTTSQMPTNPSPESQKRDSLIFPQNRPTRANSWDSSREYRPLYLVESNRRLSNTERAELGEELPELPPSQRTSRSSSQDKHLPNRDVETGTQNLADSLSIDTALTSTHQRDLLDSQQSTPKAELVWQSEEESVPQGRQEVASVRETTREVTEEQSSLPTNSLGTVVPADVNAKDLFALSRSKKGKKKDKKARPSFAWDEDVGSSEVSADTFSSEPFPTSIGDLTANDASEPALPINDQLRDQDATQPETIVQQELPSEQPNAELEDEFAFPAKKSKKDKKRKKRDSSFPIIEDNGIQESTPTDIDPRPFYTFDGSLSLELDLEEKPPTEYDFKPLQLLDQHRGTKSSSLPTGYIPGMDCLPDPSTLQEKDEVVSHKILRRPVLTASLIGQENIIPSANQLKQIWWQSFADLQAAEDGSTRNIRRVWDRARMRVLFEVPKVDANLDERICQEAQKLYPIDFQGLEDKLSASANQSIIRIRDVAEVIRKTLEFRFGAVAWVCLFESLNLLKHEANTTHLQIMLPQIADIATLMARYNVLESMYQQWPNLSLEKRYEESLIELCAHVLRYFESVITLHDNLKKETWSLSDEILAMKLHAEHVKKIDEADKTCRGFSVTIVEDPADGPRRSFTDVSNDSEDSDNTIMNIRREKGEGR